MGKADVVNLTSCRSVLDSIQHDLEARLQQNSDLKKVKEEIVDLVTQRTILVKKKDFNDRYCVLCCSSFNLLFKRKVLCSDCSFWVCRPCSSWDNDMKLWLCQVCDKQRLLDADSRAWVVGQIKKNFKHFASAKAFQGFCRRRRTADSENDSGYGQTSDDVPFLRLLNVGLSNRGNKMTDTHDEDFDDEDIGDEEELAEIHHSIETILEGLLGGTLDDASIDRMYPNVPLYEKLFASYHCQLVKAIQNLSKALQKALHNLPSENGITPTTAHASLKQVITCLIEECQDFPCLQISDQSELDSSLTFEYADLFSSYDSLIASAVINKVVEECQSKYLCSSISSTLNENSINANPQGYYRDQEIGDKNGNVENYVETTEEIVNEHAFGLPVECVQIEEVEEITQEFTDSEDDKLSSLSRWSSSLQSVESDLIKTPDLASPEDGNHRTPFPEFGFDLVDEDTEEGVDVTCHPTAITSWEENWLFRKKKRLPLYSNLKYQLLTYCDEPPCMLIPCPSDETDTVEESDSLSSELSETHSVGSLDLSSDAEEPRKRSPFLVQVVSKSTETDSSCLKATSEVSKREPVSSSPFEKLEDSEVNAELGAEQEKRIVRQKKTSDDISEDAAEGDLTGTPAKPGTIAEREHQKWLNAVPLENNPYSAENILKRGPRKSHLLESVPSFEEFEKQLHVPRERSKQRKLDCGPKSIDGDLYKRDYYINNGWANSERDRSQFASFGGDSFGALSEEALNSFEEKVYVSSGKVFTLENHVRRLERELKDMSLPSDLSSVRSLMEQQHAEPNNSSGNSVEPLPSVKGLANKFCTFESLPPNLQSSPAAPKQEPEKVKRAKPCMKVHSLTARSLSREFRHLAKQNLPKPMNRMNSASSFQNVPDNETASHESLRSPESAPSPSDNNTHGYTSDESSASTNSIPPRSKVRRHISRNILQRASYWERRVEHGLLSDASVSEEFPGLDINPEEEK